MVPSTQVIPTGSPETFGWSANYGFLSSGGWSYTLPSLSLAEGRRYADMSPTDEGGVPAYCYYLSGYTFKEPSGQSVPLYLSLAATDPSPSVPGYVCGLSQFFDDTAFEVTATLSPNSAVQTPSGESGSTPAVLATIADPDGTIYNFSTYAPTYAGSTVAWTALPSSIEDRNGNIITVTNGFTDQNCSVADICTGSISLTDTLGRPAITMNGFGATGNTISVSGLATPYTISWNTSNVSTYPITSTLEAASTSCANSDTIDFRALAPGISNISLPNGQSYSFTYDPTYGYLSKITYPGGAYIQYKYGLNSQSALDGFMDYTATTPVDSLQIGDACSYRYDQAVITERDVSFDGSTVALKQTFQYATNWVASSGVTGWSTKTTKVTTTDNVSGLTYLTVYTYEPAGVYTPPNDIPLHAGTQGYIPGNEISVQYYKDTNANGTPLLTVTKGWGGIDALTCEVHTLDSGQISGTFYSWVAEGVLASQEDYDYGVLSSSSACSDGAPSGGTPTRSTSVTFQKLAPNPIFYQPNIAKYTLPTILDRPCNVVVSGTGGNGSQTQYLYDGGTSVCGTAGGQSDPAPPGGVTSHDNSNFGPSSTSARGNATSVTSICGVGCANTTATYGYDDSGQIVSKVDGCGNSSCSDMTGTSHSTTYSYTDSPSGGNSAGNSNAYLTSVTDALGHTSSATYNYAAGLITGTVDNNKQPTQYFYNSPPSWCPYNDGWNRLSEVLYPDAGQKTYCYDDPANTVTTTTSLNISGGNETNASISDGMGHVIYTELTSDPDAPGLTDTIKTVYNGNGQIYQKTNPYWTTTVPSNWTYTYFYDALGRPASQTNPDNTSRSWQYSGNLTKFTDENTNLRQTYNDALGRLTKVLEPVVSGGTGTPETDYTYDSLNNLVKVNQIGVSGDTARVRGFGYDQLSRLTSATNPETGTTTYNYDADGNVWTKTDAQSIETTYSYDVLDRLLSKSYSTDPSSTPSSCYQYDSSSTLNGIGRLTSEWTQSASGGACSASGTFLTKRSIAAYDPMGRLKNEQQNTLASQAGGTVYSPAYTYDLAGSLWTITDGTTLSPTATPAATITFTNTYDNAEHLVSVTSNWADPSGSTSPTHPSPLFSVPTSTITPPRPNSISVPYTAFGTLANATYGSGLTLNRAYDNRLRLTCENDVGGNTAATSGTATVIITGSEQVK
jgi:YD repeat-containing protein